MSYQALYRVWRPDTFTGIVGQDAVVQTLRRQVVSGQIGHAYLFCGSRGTGKTSAAKVFSRAINCLAPVNGDPCGECEICRALKAETCMDVQEIDAASNNSVDEIRDLRERIVYPPSMTKWKVYIIDEVHMLSVAAFNALLKTLEEPPSHAVFILATTDPQKMPATVLSRCQRYDFRRIGVETIVGRLKTVLNGVGREADDDALHEIARGAEGAMRDALSLLDVCLSFTEGLVTGELVREVLGTAGRDFMFEFTDALIDFDAPAALACIDEAERRGSDERALARNVAAHLRAVMVAKLVPEKAAQILDVTQEDAERYCLQAQRAEETALTRAMELFMRMDGDLRQNMQPRTALELAAVRACHPEHESDAAVEERMARIEKLMERGVPVSAKHAPAKTAKETAEAPKPAVERKSIPAVEPPKEYNDALQQLRGEDPGIGNMLSKVKFGGLEDGVLTLFYGPREITAAKLLERRAEQLDSLFSEAFGYPVHTVLTDPGRANTKPAAGTMSAAARKGLDQAAELFGRDKIELVD